MIGRFPIANLSPEQFEAYVEQQRAELAKLDAEIAFVQALVADMEAHGHETAGEALPCVRGEA